MDRHPFRPAHIHIIVRFDLWAGTIYYNPDTNKG